MAKKISKFKKNYFVLNVKMKGKNQKASKTPSSENCPFSQSIIDLYPEDSQKQMSQILMSDTRNVISWDGNCKIY